MRVAVLVSSDLAAFLALRTVVRSLRSDAAPGAVGRSVESILPQGYLGGWQFAAALLLGLMVAGAYGAGDRRRDAARLLAGVVLAVGLSVWETLWTIGFGAAVLRSSVTVAAVWPFLALERWLLDVVVTRVRPKPGFAEKVIFVGDRDDPDAWRIAERMLTGGGMVSVGWVSSRDTETRAAYLGTVADIWAVLGQRPVDTVVICGDVPGDLLSLIASAGTVAGCRILSLSRYHDIAQVRPGFLWYKGIAFLDLTATTLRAQQLLAKRTLDLVVSVVGLVVLAPLLAVLAVLIKLDSSGPAFFRQDRIGKGGAPFRVLKFRTMRQGVSDMAHREFVMGMLSGPDTAAPMVRGGDSEAVFKLVADPRVTRVGRWLRRMSLDELPQLVNVARGEMSLVGPRPPLPYEVEAYEHWQLDRLGVLPGITGLWQVSGRNRLTYTQMCELDVTYVERWSLWLDIKILLKTIPVVLLNSGKAA